MVIYFKGTRDIVKFSRRKQRKTSLPLTITLHDHFRGLRYFIFARVKTNCKGLEFDLIRMCSAFLYITPKYYSDTSQHQCLFVVNSNWLLFLDSHTEILVKCISRFYSKIISYVPMSLDQDVSHDFDAGGSRVPTRIGAIRGPSCTKADSGITAFAIILVVTKDADSCFRIDTFTHSIKPFLVTVAL